MAKLPSGIKHEVLLEKDENIKYEDRIIKRKDALEWQKISEEKKLMHEKHLLAEKNLAEERDEQILRIKLKQQVSEENEKLKEIIMREQGEAKLKEIEEEVKKEYFRKTSEDK